MDLRIGVSPDEFPKVAKEMGFGFSLRRGRVDWDRIDTLDVDRLIQERDLMRLHENLNNIVNYSLNNEYDVKILDPNFVKLFRLAQLAVDYLMYSEQHLYNSVELLQHELSLSVKEIDRLKHECRKKDDDLKNMKKQLRERERRFPEAHAHHHHQQLNSDASGVSRCSHCGKMFMSDVYLEAHHTRRHAGLPFVAPVAEPTHTSPEIEQLQAEVKRLKEMLTQTEDKENIPQNVIIQQSSEKRDEKKEWEEEYQKKMEEWEHKYEEELKTLRQMFITEVKEPRQELLDLVTKKDEEISQLREELSQQHVQTSHEPSEDHWQEKLSTLRSEYDAAIADLREQLHRTQEENQQKVLSKAEYEDCIQELMSRLAAQDEQIRQLSELNVKTLLARPTTPIAQRVTPTREYGSSASDGPDTKGFVEPDASLTRQGHAHREILVSASGDGKKGSGQLTSKERRRKSREKVISVESDHVPEHPPLSEQQRIKEFISSLSHEQPSVKKTSTPPQRRKSIAPVTTVAVRQEESPIQQDDSSVTSSPTPDEPTQVHIDSRKTHVTPVKSKPLKAELSNKWQIGNNEASPTRQRGTLEKVQMFPEHLESEDVSEEEEISSPEVGYDSPQDKTKSHRNINSLQTTLARNPHIMTELKLDVQHVLERRLKELGVDPEWEGIPSGTFTKKMSTLQHHEKITAKRLKSYFRVRQELLEVLEIQMSADKPKTKPAAQVKTQKLNKLVSSVRERARNVFKQSRTGKRHSSRGSSIIHTKEPVQPALESHSNRKMQQRTKEPTRPELKATFFEGSTGGQTSRAKMVTSTPTKKVMAKPAKSTPVRGAMNPEPPSPQTETSTSFEDEEVRTPIQRPPAPTPRKASMGFTEVVLESPAGSKSNLKSAAALGHQAKKRVLFADHDDIQHISERGDVLRSTLPRSEKTGTLSRRLSVSDELPAGNSPLWDESLTARSNEAPESKAARLSQDSDSDWEELSTETKTDTMTALGSDSQINLSTRQSEKIALISKSIEHQLNLTRRKPAGGVEAMFGASAAAAPAPVPKPRSQLTSTAPLSEWDLEDFDD